MPQPRRIYLLDPQRLSPETIAVAFAKTSRSPQSFDVIAAELSDEQSADFHEKWVVGYGHSSVAEHAVLHIAVENISRLAVECLESNRLASYTEKSSRYQVWKRDSFHIPEELTGHPMEKEYIERSGMLFEHYQSALEKTQHYLSVTIPQEEGEMERAYLQRLRSKAADSCRYYLPASALANVGMTINARALEHALVKMLSHPLLEVRKIGEEIRSVSREIVPTLVKYADENPYLNHFEGNYPEDALVKAAISKENPRDWFACVDCDANGEARALAALLYRFSQASFSNCLATVEHLSEEEKAGLAEDLLGRLGAHDIPLRELEYAGITFDILMDQGAWFEFKRHRMMTQTPQRLTTRHGFAAPRLLHEAGVGDVFSRDMASIREFYERLAAEFPQAASYIVPNAFNRRTLVKMNLRSALHFIQLRAASNAHFAIRRVAARMAHEIGSRYRIFSRYFTSYSEESSESLDDFFCK